MRKKAPIIGGKEPDRQYDLDKESDMLELGLNPKADLKIADKYVHYQNCKHAIIEFGSTLRKAVEQLESTTKRLTTLGRKVDILIAVVGRLNKWEQKTFKRKVREKILLNRETGKPRLVRVGTKAWSILLFYSSELNKMSKGLYKYFGDEEEWEST